MNTLSKDHPNPKSDALASAEEGAEMSAPDKPSRRRFMGTGGALVMYFAWPTLASAQMPQTATGHAGEAEFPTVVPPRQLDSWIAVTDSGQVIASVGKIEAGMGISTAFTQIVAEELYVPMSSVTLKMGDTASTVDQQRGTGGSNGIIEGGKALTQAGAQARQALVAMAASRLQTDPSQLTVQDGVISVIGAPERHLSYAQLLGGKKFDLAVSGHATPKDPSQYTLVGHPVARLDFPPKAAGVYQYLVDFKLPNMLHGRMIRPPQAGAQLIEVQRDQHFPGLVAIVAQGNFLGVVCEREEQAIRASRALQVTWSKPAPLFPANYDALYDELRTEKPIGSKVAEHQGDVDAALAASAVKLEARYDYPFQSHASLGPACAVADVTDDCVSVWMGGQKPYPLRKTFAEYLGRPVEKVRIMWRPGPGGYGMNDADDAAMDALILSKAVSRPVRMQYMRADAVAWDPKGSPTTYHMRGGLDQHGNVTAFDYEARGYSSQLRPSGTDTPGDTLAGQLIGGMKGSGAKAYQLSEESYGFTNKRKSSYLLDWERSLSTGLRTAHLRDPDGMSCCFASESFIDEMAAAAHADPVEFRLAYLTDPRHKGVIQAAAAKAGWEKRAAPKPAQSGNLVTGRGIAYAPRSGTAVALVAEVEVHLDTGKFRVTRFVVAHDCGFVVNPRNLAGTIEGNLMMAMSRAKFEEVRFNNDRVTSVDWVSYPIVEMEDVPDSVEIVMVNNHPGHKSTGAGEPSSRPMAAVLSNALFDATGIRFRRVPFSQEQLKTAFDKRRQET
jgi:nicotinate dehydrogenase subunit B